jgi:hypothetical protein
MSNYLPGVTGNEFEIAGPDYEEELEIECPRCARRAMTEFGYRGQAWRDCGECGYQEDLDPIEEDVP